MQAPGQCQDSNLVCLVLYQVNGVTGGGLGSSSELFLFFFFFALGWWLRPVGREWPAWSNMPAAAALQLLGRHRGNSHTTVPCHIKSNSRARKRLDLGIECTWAGARRSVIRCAAGWG